MENSVVSANVRESWSQPLKNLPTLFELVYSSTVPRRLAILLIVLNLIVKVLPSNGLTVREASAPSIGEVLATCATCIPIRRTGLAIFLLFDRQNRPRTLSPSPLRNILRILVFMLGETLLDMVGETRIGLTTVNSHWLKLLGRGGTDTIPLLSDINFRQDRVRLDSIGARDVYLSTSLTMIVNIISNCNR